MISRLYRMKIVSDRDPITWRTVKIAHTRLHADFVKSFVNEEEWQKNSTIWHNRETWAQSYPSCEFFKLITSKKNSFEINHRQKLNSSIIWWSVMINIFQHVSFPFHVKWRSLMNQIMHLLNIGYDPSRTSRSISHTRCFFCHFHVIIFEVFNIRRSPDIQSDLSRTVFLYPQTRRLPLYSSFDYHSQYFYDELKRRTRQWSQSILWPTPTWCRSTRHLPTRTSTFQADPTLVFSPTSLLPRGKSLITLLISLSVTRTSF